MKRFIFCLLSLLLLFPLFSQGIKEEKVIQIKDEIPVPQIIDISSVSIEIFNEDEDVKNRILSIDTSSVSPSLFLRHTSKDGKAFIEYGSSYLYYSLFIDGDSVELKVSEEGAFLYLNGKQVGEKTLRDNFPLFKSAFGGINEILSSSDDFITTEIKKYTTEEWESTLSWQVGERNVEAEITYLDSDSSLWRITGYIEKDKISATLTPLNIFTEPYFTLTSVEKNGQKRDMRLW